jgi:hypothetical protein
MSEKFDIYSKIFYRDVEKFVRHLCVLVLRHQMRVSNYFVNSFYSVYRMHADPIVLTRISVQLSLCKYSKADSCVLAVP